MYYVFPDQGKSILDDARRINPAHGEIFLRFLCKGKFCRNAYMHSCQNDFDSVVIWYKDLEIRKFSIIVTSCVLLWLCRDYPLLGRGGHANTRRKLSPNPKSLAPFSHASKSEYTLLVLSLCLSFSDYKLIAKNFKDIIDKVKGTRIFSLKVSP